MTTSSVHPDNRPRSSRAVAYGWFAAMAAGWVAFFVALVGSRATLDDVWTAVRDLPIVPELVTWLLGFPFLLGLAIWQASWAEGVRLAVIAVIAAAYLFMFLPREPKP
jgi:hypothetical protein